MFLTINGKKKEYKQENISISSLLVEEEVKQPTMVSVELNGSILEDREQFDNIICKDGDVIELLYFMGGGAFTLGEGI